MKKLLALAELLMTVGAAGAGAPSTSCPSGYTMFVASGVTLVNGTSCPSGYAFAGTADGCLVASPSGACWMYAPANTEYTDDTGTYKFSEICPLT